MIIEEENEGSQTFDALIHERDEGSGAFGTLIYERAPVVRDVGRFVRALGGVRVVVGWLGGWVVVGRRWFAMWGGL
ncbi:hypothetical protein DV096_13280 [Bradymonadaceae bacterium TMQ3]|nr:hypothetical protein DV096_13280 [Bradymonadaceae bacterium TMQ3]